MNKMLHNGQKRLGEINTTDRRGEERTKDRKELTDGTKQGRTY